MTFVEQGAFEAVMLGPARTIKGDVGLVLLPVVAQSGQLRRFVIGNNDPPNRCRTICVGATTTVATRPCWKHSAANAPAAASASAGAAPTVSRTINQTGAPSPTTHYPLAAVGT